MWIRLHLPSRVIQDSKYQGTNIENRTDYFFKTAYHLIGFKERSNIAFKGNMFPK